MIRILNSNVYYGITKFRIQDLKMKNMVELYLLSCTMKK